MEISIQKSPGLRNDLFVAIPRTEIETLLFNIANRDKLMKLPGLVRSLSHQDPQQRKPVDECKAILEQHLRALSINRSPLLNGDGSVTRRVLAIGARNVGNNHGVVAWQRDQTPRFFHVEGDPLNFASYACVTQNRDGGVGIRHLRFDDEQVYEGDRDVTDEIEWCTYGNPIIRDGQVLSLEDIIDQFTDVRHVLAFERQLPFGRAIEAEIYAGYPQNFRERTLSALRESGVPRQRFLHNCLGFSDDRVFIQQREGTIEEAATWLKEAGARDAIILDNGGSVFCWGWWPYPSGGFIFTAPDYRPRSSAVLVFVLRGSARTDLPEGSVGFTVV